MRISLPTGGLILAPLLSPLAGCLTLNLDASGANLSLTATVVAAARVSGAVSAVQVADPRQVALPPALTAQGGAVVIDASARFLSDVEQQLDVAQVPVDLVLGFENVSAFDGYYTYRIDGVSQSVFVFPGQTVLLEYPCPQEVQLLSEAYFDPTTGAQVSSFTPTDALFGNPDRFRCGDALILLLDSECTTVHDLAFPLL